MLAFAGYGFNQGHATAYAEVSYRMAYLKAHWPAAFLCARLAERGGFHHPAVYMAEAVRRGGGVIEKRTRYVRAMNFIMASLHSSYLATVSGENPDYFQLHRRRTLGLELVCSVPYPGERDWQPIDNHTVTAL